MESATTWATADEEDTVLDVLDEALRAGVLLEEGSAASISYTFWHPLLVTHLYERLSATRRTRLHRRAAEILQRLYADKEQEIAATMTHHLVQAAADPRQIIHYAELAGHHAYALLAYPEAERHYRLAVEYMDIIGNRPTETTLPVSLPDAATLLERLAECCAVQGNFAEARTLYERSLKIRSQRRATDIDPHDEAQRQALLWGEIGRLWRYTGDTAQALTCCERGEAILRDAGVVAGPAWARLRYQASSFYESEGRYEEARHASQEALALFEKSPSHNTSSVAQRPSSAPPTRIERTLEGDPVDLGRTYALLGMLDYNVGQQASALAHLTNALTLYEQYDRQREIAHVTCNIGHVHLKRGEYEAAHAALRRSRSLAERIGDGPLISVIFTNLAELEACAGNLVQAEEWYRKSLILAERFNDRQYISQWHAGLASVLIAQGKLSEAAASVSKALHMARTMRNTPCLGAALVALSNVRIAEALATPENHAITRLRLLTHARRALERALSFDHLYAETRIKAQEMLPRVMQLLEQETHQQA
jgi:tetratricopeptide (TPR) repeat protein